MALLAGSNEHFVFEVVCWREIGTFKGRSLRHIVGGPLS